MIRTIPRGMGYRERCFEHHDRACWVCGEPENQGKERSNIEVHHIRGLLSSDTPDNLVPLCTECHHRVHSDELLDGDLGKLQHVLWSHQGSRDVTHPAEFVFENGELRYRVDTERNG